MDYTIGSYFLDAGKDASVLVKKYNFLNLDEKFYLKKDKHIPDGSCCIVFNFSGQVLMTTPDGTEINLPPFFLTIPYLGHVSIVTKSPIDSLIVSCKTSVFTRVFDFPLDNHERDSYISVNKIIPDSLWMELKNESCPKKRIGIFESFLSSISSLTDYKPDVIDIAYENIYSSGGTAKISSIVSESGINERSFRKIFKKRVGLCAKSLSRLVRICVLCKTLSETRDINLMDVVHMGNFFDQAHFDHEIKNIIGETPNKFFKRDLEFVRVFSGF